MTSQTLPKTESLSKPQRFTLDGSDALELHLERICGRVLEEVRSVVPGRALEALVLGGGYGRGQGGVLKTEDGEQPYNDLEFYVFVRGNRLWNEHRYRAGLAECARRLSREAALHVEFKVDSITRLRRSPVSMFSYDLIARHRMLHGTEALFRGCAHHLAPERIPVSEATRLLFNRCTGLLLTKELLQKSALTPEEANFAGRNFAKAKLALGDAVLAACGRYHWSCLERHTRIKHLTMAGPPPWLPRCQDLHQEAVEFKLHPQRICQSLEELRPELDELAELALQVWLWLEARRLCRHFASAREYAFHRAKKWPGTSVWKNLLLNVKTFGLKAALGTYGARYPRERLFNALCLLLWNNAPKTGCRDTQHLQQQLRTNAHDWAGLVAVYKQIWHSYG